MAKGAPVIASSGILVEDKTRRFIVNDKREIYYRAEVQNRVYKREIVEVSHEFLSWLCFVICLYLNMQQLVSSAIVKGQKIGTMKSNTIHLLLPYILHAFTYEKAT